MFSGRAKRTYQIFRRSCRKTCTTSGFSIYFGIHIENSEALPSYAFASASLRCRFERKAVGILDNQTTDTENPWRKSNEFAMA